MISWMLYSLLIAILLTLAAYGAEGVLKLVRRPTRWVWLSALGLSFALPAVLPWLPELFARPAVSLLPQNAFTLNLDLSASAPAAQRVVPWSALVLYAWVALAAVLSALGGWSLIRLLRARVSWRRAELDDSTVLISDDVGPAVIGVLTPAIVIPEWVTSLPRLRRTLILAHEREHIAARDPWLVLLSQLAPVVMPWNPAIWLQARRLRECVELDCDARLLAAGSNVDGYAALLLDVGQHHSRHLFAAAAMAEPRSLLEKRIRRMFESRPRHAVPRALAWAGLALIAVFAAFETPLPAQAAKSSAITAQPEQQQQEQGPTFTPMTVRPELKNVEEIKDALKQFYPPLLRDAGIGGSVSMWFYIDKSGAIKKLIIKQSSGHEALDNAALQVAALMQFTPAKNREEFVAVWVDMPIVFKTAPGAPTSDRLGTTKVTPRKPEPDRPTPRRESELTVTPRKAEPGSTPTPRTRASQATVRDTARQPTRVDVLERTIPSRQAAPAAPPQVAADTTRPTLANSSEVRRALTQYYPPLLRDAGIGGTVEIWFFVNEKGRVTKTQIKRSSGHEALDDAAMRIAEFMQFAPAMSGGRAVSAWIELPITFASQ